MYNTLQLWSLKLVHRPKANREERKRLRESEMEGGRGGGEEVGVKFHKAKKY